MQSSQTPPVKPDAVVESKTKPAPPEQKTVNTAPPKTAPAAKAEKTLPKAAKPDAVAKTPTLKVTAPDVATPTFDVVRVEPDGSAVIAGRARPGWKVVVQSKGKIIGEAIANARGEWVIISDQPVPPGTSDLKLTASSPDNKIKMASSQIVAISRPDATMKTPGKMAAAQIPGSKVEAPADKPILAAKPAPVSSKPEAAPKTDTPATKTPATAAKPDTQAQKETVSTKTGSDADVAKASTAPSVKTADVATKKPDSPAPKSVVPEMSGTDTAAAKTPAEPATRMAEASAKDKAALVAKPDVPGSVKTKTPVAGPIGKKLPEVAKPLIVVSEPGQASRVLQAPSEEIREAMAPLTFRSVDYNDKGQVILSGKAKKGSTLRVYLDNDFIGSATTGDDGTWVLKTRKDVNPGKYALRVDQIGRGNKIVSRVEAPFERAAPEVVKQARKNSEVVIQPGDNLWNISRALYGRGVQYTVIYEANKNKIKDPDLIYPGQIFATPDSDPATAEK